MRGFLTALAVLAGVAVTTVGVHAQPRPTLPLIAILAPGSVSTPAGGFDMFKPALAELGRVEGRRGSPSSSIPAR